MGSGGQAPYLFWIYIVKISKFLRFGMKIFFLFSRAPPIKNLLPSTLNTEVISKTYFLLRYYVLCIALIVDVDYIFNKNLTFGH